MMVYGFLGPKIEKIQLKAFRDHAPILFLRSLLLKYIFKITKQTGGHLLISASIYENYHK